MCGKNFSDKLEVDIFGNSNVFPIREPCNDTTDTG